MNHCQVMRCLSSYPFVWWNLLFTPPLCVIVIAFTSFGGIFIPLLYAFSWKLTHALIMCLYKLESILHIYLIRIKESCSMVEETGRFEIFILLCILTTHYERWVVNNPVYEYTNSIYFLIFCFYFISDFPENIYFYCIPHGDPWWISYDYDKTLHNSWRETSISTKTFTRRLMTA